MNEAVQEYAIPGIEKAIIGCLIGTAVADAVGLPYEGIAKRRAIKLFGPPTGHRLIFGRGMVSDDTEHTCMVAQALIESAGEPELFQRRLIARLRRWLLMLPAGVGFATLRAIVKSSIGFSPECCGVYSAGNGPAMRSAILGVAIGSADLCRELTRGSALLTHTDPKALYGAWAVSLAARMSARESDSVSPSQFRDAVRLQLQNEPATEFLELVDRVVESIGRGETTEALAASIGCECGVSGYVYHTVPVALHAWLSHPEDYREAVLSVIRCGGDTDSTAAIVGGIVGARVGKAGIPEEWLSNLCEWPRTIAWMEELGQQLARAMTSHQVERPVALPALGVLTRNLAFLSVVLAHGFRRLAPPY